VVAVPTPHAGPFVAWASAWLAGAASFDHVLGSVGDTAVLDRTPGGLGAAGGPCRSLGEVLVEWRRLRSRVRLVLPVPGDVRGLSGPDEYRAAALEAGEAAYGGGLGLVPQVIDNSPSSAPASLLWQLFAVEPARPDDQTAAEAQLALTDAIRECASTLASGDLAGWSEAMREPLADARRAGERLDLPPVFPTDAVRLIAQAERIAAVLTVATTDPLGGVVDQAGAAAREAALRPLATAVRRARLAGYNALS
jgi:hypothetical protein